MVFLLFLFIPVLPAMVVEYAACRFPKRRLWRWVPPAGTVIVTAAVTLSRYHGWSAGAEKAPWETLLFIPGLPALGVFLGLWLGWRLWRRLWLPRVVKDRK